MKEGKASWTAQGVTFYRALESARPEGEAAFSDPLAAELLDSWFAWVARRRHRRRIAGLVIGNSALSISYRSVVDRTVLIDDCVSLTRAAGIEQLVLLGAGFDTRAYRLIGPDGPVKVFEVDHPDTQRIKLARLKKAIGPLPDNVVYVPVDFEQEKTETRLLESGYDGGAATLFIWEGVMSYLTPEAVDETLALIAGNSGSGSTVVFTYLLLEASGDREARTRRRHETFLRMRGEPHIFWIDADQIEEFLSRRGLELVESRNLPLPARATGRRRFQERPAHGAIAFARVR